MCAPDAVDECYTARIGKVDLHARLFRECEAMVAFAGARGLALEPAVRAKLGLLEVGIARREDVTLAEFTDLHGSLAQAVQPALPRSLELMAWDARTRPFFHRFAPVPALRQLMGLAAAFVALFCWVFTTGDITARSVEQDLYTLALQERLFPHLLFYFALAGIGASFQSLYDAYGYVRDGKYDPGYDSTYIIRIGLGLIAGLVLAQLVPQSWKDAPDGGLSAMAVAKPLLALIGGFAAQLVHRILNRLVQTVDGLFRPEARRQVELQARELRAEQRQAEAERVNTAAVEAAPLLARLETADDPAERADLLDRLTAVFMPTSEAGRAREAAPTGGVVQRYLDTARRWVGTAGVLAELLPRDARERTRAFVEDATSKINRVDDLRRTLREGDVVAAARDVVDVIRDTPDNPMTDRLRGVLDRFGPLLQIAKAGPLAGATLGPAGLAFGVLAMGLTLSAGAGRAYARWQARVLDADYDPDLMPPGIVNAFGVEAALTIGRDHNDPVAAFFAERLTEPKDLQRFGELALTEVDPRVFLDAYADVYPGSREELAAGLAAFRRTMRDQVVADDVPTEVLRESGARDARELLAALDEVGKDEAARGDLELLALMGERVRTGALALDDVKEALDAAERASGAGRGRRP